MSLTYHGTEFHWSERNQHSCCALIEPLRCFDFFFSCLKILAQNLPLLSHLIFHETCTHQEQHAIFLFLLFPCQLPLCPRPRPRSLPLPATEPPIYSSYLPRYIWNIQNYQITDLNIQILTILLFFPFSFFLTKSSQFTNSKSICFSCLLCACVCLLKLPPRPTL